MLPERQLPLLRDVVLRELFPDRELMLRLDELPDRIDDPERLEELRLFPNFWAEASDTQKISEQTAVSINVRDGRFMAFFLGFWCFVSW